MISRDDIQKICEAGVQAPSGSNSQPWRLMVAGEVVSVFMMPEKDHPVLNARHGGTLIATGALLENMAIAASHFGFHMDMTLFPDVASDPNLVARATFSPRPEDGRHDFYDAIWRRATNRKPYETTPLAGDIEEKLQAIPETISAKGIGLKLVHDRAVIASLARAAATNETIMFGNTILRKLFFKELVWTEQEERSRGGGLYLPTMELAPQKQSALKLFRNPFFGKLLAMVGVPQKIAEENAVQYAQCAAYGGVVCGTTDADFVNVGRVIEHAWLAATTAGLSFHLQTGVNFLRLSEKEGDRTLSVAEKKSVDAAYKTMADSFNAENDFVAALFRIGRGGEPSARSIKVAPRISFS